MPDPDPGELAMSPVRSKTARAARVSSAGRRGTAQGQQDHPALADLAITPDDNLELTSSYNR